jgi:hypothetical protein
LPLPRSFSTFGKVARTKRDMDARQLLPRKGPDL